MSPNSKVSIYAATKNETPANYESGMRRWQVSQLLLELLLEEDELELLDELEKLLPNGELELLDEEFERAADSPPAKAVSVT